MSSFLTDFHAESVEYPTCDLPTLMTKKLHVAMPLINEIKAVTLKPLTHLTMTPVAAIGRSMVIFFSGY